MTQMTRARLPAASLGEIVTYLLMSLVLENLLPATCAGLNPLAGVFAEVFLGARCWLPTSARIPCPGNQLVFPIVMNELFQSLQRLAMDWDAQRPQTCGAQVLRTPAPE